MFAALRKMSKNSDFLSWDDDIDLDNLLGDYTDCGDSDEFQFDSDDAEYVYSASEKKTDENFPTKKQKIATKKTHLHDYKCPECSKSLKTIAGFRGHMTKQHHQPNTKASDFKVNIEAEKSKFKVNTPTFTDKDKFQSIFSESYMVSLRKLKTDPMATTFAPACHFQLIEHAASSNEFKDFLQSCFSSIFYISNVNVSLSADREHFFSEFHKMRVNPEIRARSLKLFSSVECNDSDKMNFLQWFFLDLINEILIQQLKLEQKTSSEKCVEISKGDQEILFYIAGYISRSIKKRYLRSKSNEVKLELMSVLESDGSSSFVNGFSGWVNKVDRGGLCRPSDSYYLLIREFENVMRKYVDIDKVSAKSLMVAELKELILESFMVKHYTVKLFGSSDRAISVLEDIVSLFLRVRGFAIARLQRNKIMQASAIHKKSLRKSLKEKSFN